MASLEKPSIRASVGGRIRTIARWTQLLLPILGALLGLYATFFLLQFVSLVPSLKGFGDQALGPMELSLKRAEMFSDDTHELHGNTHKPGAVVEIGVNNHLLDTTYANADGIFDTSISIPIQTNWIWVRARDSGNGRILITDQKEFSWSQESVQPSLQMAYAVTDDHLLWIAGSSAPNAWIRLRDEEGQILGEVGSNHSGGFDAILSLRDPIPTQITAQAVNPDGSPSAPLDVSPIEGLPLSRQAVFDLNTSKPILTVEVRLPESHPNLQSLIQGYMTSAQFLDAVFPLREAWSASTEVTHTLSLEPQSNALPMALVNITVKWQYAISGITIYRGAIYPLLTDKDSITLKFNGLKPAWFNLPYPTTLSPDQATWLGMPADSGSTYEAISLGLSVPPGTPTINAPEPEAPTQDTQSEQKKIEEKKMLDFIRSFESSSGGNFGANTWRTLILLIPYTAMLWLWRRRHFGRSEIWLPLAAMIVVLAVWRIWNYLYYLLQIGPGLWLQKAITPLRLWLDLSGTKDQNILLSDAPGNAYCILLLGLLALTPLYLPVLEQILANMSSPALPVQRGRFVWPRRILLGIRVLLGVLLLALIVGLFQLHPSINISLAEKTPLLANLVKLAASRIGEACSANLFPYLQNPLWLAVVLTMLIGVFLWIWSWPAGLFGTGLVVIAVRTALAIALKSPDFGQDPANFLVQEIVGIPWWVFLAISAALTYPLVHRMLKILAPSILTSEKWKRRFRWLRALVAVGLIALAFGLPYTSSIFLLGAAGVLILTSLVYLMYHGFKNLQTTRQLLETIQKQPWIAVLVGVLILAVAWPIAGPGTTELHLQSLFGLVAHADQMFAFILSLALVLLLREDACADSVNSIFGWPVMEAGIVLFAVFMINSSTSWLFIPVPFLVGLIVARTWLFQPESEIMKIQAAVAQMGQEREKMIKDILDESKARYSYKKIESALNKKIEAAEITGKQYEARIAKYKQHFGDRLSLEKYPNGLTSKKIAFAVGEKTPWSNTRQMLALGALLALLPLLIALYEYLPSSSVSYPYPLADLLVFLLSATASWMLYAFFFGYFYIHLRGNNGLTKGLVLFVGLVIPFAAYRLLSAQTLQEMRPFLLWATQIFLFTTMLGLLGVEYRLIRQHGYQMRDLLAAHNLPALSVYVSTVIAALAPTIIAAVTGRLGDVVEFFLNTVLPRVPSGGP